MIPEHVFPCSRCGLEVGARIGTFHYQATGLPNVFLQGVEIFDCPHCANTDVTIPHPLKVHRAIAMALTKSPRRLTGPQLRFLRKHLKLSGEQFAQYLHTDKASISLWEQGEETISPSTDRLVRLLAAALDADLLLSSPAIASQFPNISDDSGGGLDLYVDVVALTTSFLSTQRAA